MLVTCSKVLLLTDDYNLIREYKSLAKACNVELQVEAEWDEAYRITADRVIATTNYLGSVNSSYYPSVVLILKENETFLPYRDFIDDYIFDTSDARALMFAFLRREVKFAQYATDDLKDIMEHSNSTHYIRGAYDFNFERGEFKYKGKALYISKGQQAYLAEWLLNGHKDNAKRIHLWNMRQKFGKEFLLDVDKYGQIRAL